MPTLHDLQAQCRIDTPLGPMTAAASARGLAGLWFDGQRHHPGTLNAPEDASHPMLVAAARWLLAYFASEPPGGAAAPALDLQGTPFQRRVWQALLTIPVGGHCSYGDLARQLGSPAAVRAVGAAVGRNPVSVLVPCHRVLGADGSLTGYAGGLARKRALLQLEGALPEAQGPRSAEGAKGAMGANDDENAEQADSPAGPASGTRKPRSSLDALHASTGASETPT